MSTGGYSSAVVRWRDPASPELRWVSPGQRVNAGGYPIPGGLVYFGRHARSPAGEIEPALINLDLPVAPVLPTQPPPVGPNPAYHLLSPAARAAYLGWLAGGRRGVVPAGLVLLFCFGLERRVLVDAGDDLAVHAELPAILAEARRLRARYGEAGGPALRGTLDRLLDLLELLTAPRCYRCDAAGANAAGPLPPARPPEMAPPRSGPGQERPAPMSVRIALAGFAATGTPVPVDWARVWVRYHPSLAPRSAQLRCPAEFDQLFALRYRDRHGAGLVPVDDVPGIRLRYQPANPGLTAALVCREDLPNVLAEPRSTRTLGRLVDVVAAALDPYNRWLARFPAGHGSLAAAALMPPELIDSDRGRLGALRVWAEARLDGRPRAVVEAAEFAEFWSTASRHRMTRDEAAAFIEVLALIGMGLEPDVRFGGPPLADGPVVLFRLGPAVAVPGPRFRAGSVIARCAAAVASAAGPVEPLGRTGAAVLVTATELAAALRLEPPGETRLAARLAWLLATGVNLDRLARHVASLDPGERDLAGEYLVAVATTADPTLGPATITVLARVYRMLGLDQTLLYRRLHECGIAGPRPPASTARLGRPAGPEDPDQPESDQPAQQDHPPGRDEPVMVRSADPVADGYALPWATTPFATEPASEPASERAGLAERVTLPAGPDTPPGQVRLDRAAISRKLAESAAGATLLAAIFDEDGPAQGPDGPAQGPDGPEPVAGLDPAHSALLRALAARPSWTREEFAVLAGAQGVLPDGALDLLNEIAIDVAGAPVIECGVTLAVDDDVLQELLG